VPCEVEVQPFSAISAFSGRRQQAGQPDPLLLIQNMDPAQQLGITFSSCTP
jgi:hypothetical protein